MNLKEYFEIIDLDEIERFITDKQEENVSLEFKTVNHPDYNKHNREFDKKNMSEAFSGFANSNGGIIIWGIKAKENENGQDVAKTKKPIEKLTKFLNLLNRLEGQAVTPIVEGISHEKIETSEDVGFIKTYIPKSENAPHMANFSGKHYYKRSGDSFYPCEHYDIIDMFSRKKSPNLEIFIRNTLKKTGAAMGQHYSSYTFAISLFNKGQTIAKYPHLAFNITGATPEPYGVDGNGNRGLKKKIETPMHKHNYAGGNDHVIYPQTMIDVDLFFIHIPSGSYFPQIQIDYLISAENMKNVKGKYLIEDASFDNCAHHS